MPVRMLKFLPLVVLLAACAYRQDIPQGNFFKTEDVAKLAPGMTREQVQFVMGTPQVADPYHPDRWDYVFYVDALDDVRDYHQRVTVFFDGDRVGSIEKFGIEESDADTVPTGDEGISAEGED